MSPAISNVVTDAVEALLEPMAVPSIEPLSILILVNALSLASIAEINLVADKSVN